jgi:hypothetical protein
LLFLSHPRLLLVAHSRNRKMLVLVAPVALVLRAQRPVGSRLAWLPLPWR